MTKSKSKILAEERERKRKAEQMSQALEWCEEHKAGAKACLKANPQLNGDWSSTGLVTVSALQHRLSKRTVDGGPSASRLLTDVEERQLAEWCRDHDEHGEGIKTRTEVCEKIQEILKLRRRANRRGGRKHAKLGRAASNVVFHARVSDQWFLGFYARHGDIIKDRTPQEVDQKRQDTCNEDIIDLHFEGTAGLRRELIAAGIMDDGGNISDPRRVINIDEIPQMAD